MYQTLIFDLDGTLTDSGLGIINSVAYALEKMGVEEPDLANLKRFIGPPLYESFARFYNFSPEQVQEAVGYFREYFKERGMFENQPYPGIAEVLSGLKEQGKELLIATSKPEVFAKQILNHFHLDGYFSVIAGASLDSSRISKEQVIAHALTQRPNLAKPAVMIGDREHDIKGAQAHHLDSIGVLYGYGQLEELTAAGATHIIQSVEQLGQFFSI
ncbi:HAD family hydrolase [Streptococcus oriscaviae]|uniref:HAD family hydrolase n=1 Tax=Streptococcus oriscaviae TaxID=2781599 RepID=A0ABX7YLQ9_9STRE|nr:HAD family hydrolase [Streptococcus oriscaviae]QUE54772.1 HAD family hydrolase [Streptococcus oriscaviae]